MSRFNRVGRVLQACRVCGCTQHRACVDDDGHGCYWAEPDLCSACALPKHQRMPDESLDYWGDAFAGAGLAGRMTFEQFLELPERRREAEIAAVQVQERLERQLRSTGHDCEVRDGRLIEPLHHGPGRGRADNRPVGHYLRRALK